MNKNKYFIIISIIIIISGVYLLKETYQSYNSKKIIKVGYPPVSTSLPLFVAIEEGLFEKKGINVEPIRFETANQIVEALVTDRISATSVCADFPLLAIATQKNDAFKIYAWEMLDTEIAFDMILSKKDSSIKTLKDLCGKKIATFPGSQLKHYLKLILSNALGTVPDITIIEMAPSNQIAALASGSVDAIFCLEPIGTIALVQEIGQVVSSSPISKYIGGGKPFPAASFAVSSSFINKYPNIAKDFVHTMWLAMEKINKDQKKYRYLYPKFTPIKEDLAGKIPVTLFTKVPDMDLSLFQKEADILYKAGLLEKEIQINQLVYQY